MSSPQPLAIGNTVINDRVNITSVIQPFVLPQIQANLVARARGWTVIGSVNRPGDRKVVETLFEQSTASARDAARRLLLRALNPEQEETSRFTVADYVLPAAAMNHLLLALGPWDVYNDSGTWKIRDVLQPDDVEADFGGAVHFEQDSDARVSAVVLEEAATNQVLNPIAGATGNFGNLASGTVARSTTTFLTGENSYSVTTTASGDGGTWTLSALSNAIHYVTFYQYGDAPNDLQVSLDGSNWHDVTALPAIGSWTRYGAQIKAALANASTTLRIRQNGTGSGTFYVDLLQVEAKSYPTTGCHGAAGPGYSWSGTEHASTSARTASYLDLDDHVDLISGESALTIRLIVDMPYDSDADWPDDAILFDARGSSDDNRLYLSYDDADDEFHVYVNGADRFQSAAQTFSAGDRLMIFLVLDFEGDATLYIDGSQDGTVDISSLSAPTLTAWRLGSDYAGTNQANASFVEFQVLDVALSAYQATLMPTSPVRARWLDVLCTAADPLVIDGKPSRRGVVSTLEIDDEVRFVSRDGDTAFLRAYGASAEITVDVDTDDLVCPTFRITPKASKTTGFDHLRYVIIPWTDDSSYTNYPFLLDTLNLTGKAQADGDDIRVYVDGIEIDRWLGGTLVSSVKIWSNFDFAAQQTATLGEAIGSSDEGVSPKL